MINGNAAPQETKRVDQRSVLGYSVSAVLMNILKFVNVSLASVFLARGLQPQGRGEYAVVVTVAGTLAMLGSLGIYASCSYYVSKKTYSLGQIFPDVLLINLVLALLLSGVALAFKGLILQALRLSLELDIYLCAIPMVVCQLLTSSFSGMLYGAHYIHRVNLWYSLSSVLLPAVMFTTLFIFKLGTFGALLSFALTNFLDMAALACLVITADRLLLMPSWQRTKAILSYGLKVHVGRSVQFLNYRLATFLVSRYLGAVAVGYYSVADSTVATLWMVPDSVGLVLLPNLVQMDTETRKQMSAKVCRGVLFFVAALAVPFCIFGSTLIIALYGSEYDAAVLPFLLLVPGVVMLAFFKLLTPYFQAIKAPAVPSYASLVGLVLTVFLYLFMIPRWQLSGAALAATIARAAQGALMIMLFVASTRQSVSETILLQRGEFRVMLSLGLRGIRVIRQWLVHPVMPSK